MTRTDDQDTRERIVEVASRLFADQGFRHVTVREICGEAGANVAAVNYYFGDKLGLYRDVVERGIAMMQQTTELATRRGAAQPPEERLSLYIDAYVRRLLGNGGDSWLHRLMSKEMADPTPALDEIVERVIKPRIRVLSEMVAEIIGCDYRDPRVMLSVASIQAQCTMALPHPIADRVRPRPKWVPSHVDALVRHIVEFSIAGVRAIAEGTEAGQMTPHRRPSRVRV
jgi:TetR/AcrR family transcriptional regulator, regulator of cefoperazone and chloramphenicol sensitivity